MFYFSLQAQMKLKYAQQELKTKQAEVKKMDGSYKEDQEAFEAIRKTKEKLQDEMKKLKYEGFYIGFWCIILWGSGKEYRSNKKNEYIVFRHKEIYLVKVAEEVV